MSVITEGNRIYFWFDHGKKRNFEGKAEAIKRWQEVSRNGNKSFHSIHHLDANRENGSADNLFVCETEKQHNNLHSQLQEFTTWAYRTGILQFDFTKKKYFVQDTEVC